MIFLGILSYLFFIALGVGVFAVALILSSKKSKKNISLEDQLRNIISSARRIRFKADSDINKLKLWANQAIADSFGDMVATVPTDELLDRYEEIRSKYGKQLDAIVLDKLDSLINGYKAQIELKRTEREAAEKVEQKYSALLKDLRQAKQKQKIVNRLETQTQRLSQMQNNIEIQKKLLEQSYSYDVIEEDVKQKVAAMEALDQLQQKYSSPELIEDTTIYREELKQITKKLDI